MAPEEVQTMNQMNKGRTPKNNELEQGEDPRVASGEMPPSNSPGLGKGEKVAEWSEDQEEEEEDPAAP
jgi:hypothetical protein